MFHLLTFTNPIAEAYVKGSIGNVVTVFDDKVLTQTPRGLTRDGKASGSYKMFTVKMNEEELVFGQNARELALLAKKNRLASLNEQQTGIDREFRSASFWRSSVEKCRSPQIEKALEELELALREQSRLNAELSSWISPMLQTLKKKLKKPTRPAKRLRRRLRKPRIMKPYWTVNASS